MTMIVKLTGAVTFGLALLPMQAIALSAHMTQQGFTPAAYDDTRARALGLRGDVNFDSMIRQYMDSERGVRL